MKLIIEESDFKELGELPTPIMNADSKHGSLTTKVSSNNSKELEKAVTELLPNVIKNKFQSLAEGFSGYKLKAFELEVTIAGSPFGIGVDGTITLQFEID